MIILLPKGEGCEIQLADTQDAIHVSHLGSAVKVQEFVTTHDSFGKQIFSSEVNRNGMKPLLENDSLTDFQMMQIILKYRVTFNWEYPEADDDNPDFPIEVQTMAAAPSIGLVNYKVEIDEKTERAVRTAVSKALLGIQEQCERKERFIASAVSAVSKNDYDH